MKLENSLILSIFPGIDLLGRAFEDVGFCVVRGPDLITGGDIRQFTPPSGRFDGVIGGPPCQDFSRLNRHPTGYSDEMIDQYIRVVEDSGADWYLFENVVAAPSFEIPGYTSQRFALDLAWFSDFSRTRDFVYGSLSGELLNPMVATRQNGVGPCVTGSDERSFSAICEIQGLGPGFEIPFFSLEGKKQAVANGVPIQMGTYVARLVARDLYGVGLPEHTVKHSRRCKCGCGRAVVGKALYASVNCRKRAQRHRELRR